MWLACHVDEKQGEEAGMGFVFSPTGGKVELKSLYSLNSRNEYLPIKRLHMSISLKRLHVEGIMVKPRMLEKKPCTSNVERQRKRFTTKVTKSTKERALKV